MAVSSGISCILASCIAVLLFAGMQIYKSYLVSSQIMTIVGGFFGAQLFVLILTAVGNLETQLFGKTFQTKLVPEVVICLLIAMFASGLVHRVCITTCLIFSLVSLYYINKLSIATYSPSASATVAPVTKGKKKN